MKALMNRSVASVGEYAQVLERSIRSSVGEVRTILLSHEGLLNRVFAHDPGRVGIFNDVNKKFDVDFMAVTRERSAWLRSTYRQAIVNTRNEHAEEYSPAARFGTGMTYHEFLTHKYTQDVSNHSAAVEKLTSLFRPRNLFVTQYETDWFAAITGFIDPDLDWPPLPVERKNVTVPDVYLDILRQVNARRPSGQEISAWKAAIKVATGVNNVEITREAVRFSDSGHSLQEFISPASLERLCYCDNPPLSYTESDFDLARSGLLEIARSSDNRS